MQIPLPTSKNTGVVIVTYNPNDLFLKTISAAKACFSNIYIIDNSEDLRKKEFLSSICNQYGVRLFSNEFNTGIADAFNKGIDLQEDPLDWILLLDQDSIIIPDILKTISKIYLDFDGREKIAVIGSNFFEAKRKSSDGSVPALASLADSVISSGSFIPLKNHKIVGPFRSDFFIDLVDIEYCLRARAKGFKILVSNTPLMHHQIGEMKEYNLGFKSTATSNHAAFRRYFMMRNHIVLIKEYFAKYPGWVLSSLSKRAWSILLILLFEKRKKLKLKFTLLGLYDGLISNFNRNRIIVKN